MQENHKYIQFTGKSKKGLNTEAGFLVIDYFLKTEKKSRDKWRKEKKSWNVNWIDNAKKKQISKSINYLIIAEYIRQKGSFDTLAFNLPIMECFWLDTTLDLKLNFHFHDHTGTVGIVSGIPQQQYGEKYPIKPKLQREGHLYTSFQPQLLKRIISQRTKLVTNSDTALEDEWIFDLRTLISDTISLIDITLTQFYIKAEYNPLPNWTFDKMKLGERHGRRLNDKFKWVYQITGNNINIESELSSLNNLKNLRNHLMHFDPPSLVITIEEVAIWLNQIIDIGIILFKLRNAMNAEISSSLVNFILQQEVEFKSRITPRQRQAVGINPNEDYASSIWPSPSPVRSLK